VLLLTGVIVGGCGDAGATITRLTVGTAGPDPYVLMSGTDRQRITTSPRGGGTKDGDAPGLYGGTRQAATCDPAKLVAFLQANPGKARAWASVHKIKAADIPGFVAKLTPVLLRVDTLVVNHGYKNGEPTTMTAVLQAGMGVLVNQYGVPVVKCNCGNPLSQPDEKISTGNAKYTGASWPGFTKRKVTKIRTKRAVTSFVLVDPDATMGFERPAATAGGQDGPPVEVPEEERAVPSPDDSGSVDPSTSPEDSPPPDPTDGTSGQPTDGVPPGGGPTNVDPNNQYPDQQSNGETTEAPPTSMGPMDTDPDPDPAY
jgi:hypothetical protein